MKNDESKSISAKGVIAHRKNNAITVIIITTKGYMNIRLQPGGTGAAVNLHTGTLPGTGREKIRDRGHTPTCETCGTGPT